MSGTSLRSRRGADYLSVRGNLPGDAGETLTGRVHSRDQPAAIAFDGGLDVGTLPTHPGRRLGAAHRSGAPPDHADPAAGCPPDHPGPADVTTAAGGAAITRPPLGVLMTVTLDHRARPGR